MIARPNFRPFYLARGDEAGTLSVSQIEQNRPLWCGEHAHQGAITQLAWSPDGQYLASGGNDGRVHIWWSATGELLSTFRHGQPVERLRWSEDSARIAALSGASVHLWPLPEEMAAAA